MAKAYEVNYNDKRFTQVESQEKAALKESNSMYDSMIKQSDSYYQKQVDAVNQYEKTQLKNQEDQHKQAIAEIEQQKEYAHQDYLKEQTGAYVDWQKQSDQYGTNAEQMAASGLAHTGYSESSQVAMYNTYQNRVATARESYQRSVDSYNNAINNAILQNNSHLAEIAYNTLRQRLELSLQGFQYKNTLLQTKADAKREIDKDYYTRYQNVLSQINHENSMAEQIRQYNASLKEQQRQYNQNYALDKKKYDESVRQYNANLKLQQQQLAEEKRQFNENLAWQKKKAELDSSGGGGGGYLPDDEPKDDGGGRLEETYTKMTKQQALTKVNKGQVKNYGAAQTLLRNLGILGKAKVPMLDSITWQKAKKTGILSSEFEDIKTYGQYVQRYCRYAINECM